MFYDQKEDLLSPNGKNTRNTYEPPRKNNKDFLHPKLNFLKEKEGDGFDWKRQIEPSWITEWIVD